MSKRQKFWVGVLCVVAIAAAWIVLFPMVWMSPPFSARVIDAVTKQGIEGADVEVSWTLEGTFSNYPVHVIALERARTDSSGKFDIAGWGPRFRFGLVHAAKREPVVEIEKSGYARWRKNSNELVATMRYGNWGMYIEPAVHGRVIELERAR